MIYQRILSVFFGVVRYFDDHLANNRQRGKSLTFEALGRKYSQEYFRVQLLFEIKFRLVSA